MARPVSIDETELLVRLSCVFRDMGFDGASLAALSRATGLKKASLYHRFPGGKEQMAREVLAAALAWLDTHVLAPLRTDSPPAARVQVMVRKLDEFYDGGRQSCLLNMLSSPHVQEGPFTGPIRDAFAAIVAALAAVVVDAGFDRPTARARAERAVMLLQGSLVMSRGMGTTRPFRRLLASLPDELLAKPARPSQRSTR
jgi:AcrR family transcriptional regulator